MKTFAVGPLREKRWPSIGGANELEDSGVFRVTGFSGGLMSFRRDIASRATFDTRIREGGDVDFVFESRERQEIRDSPRVRLSISTSLGRTETRSAFVDRAPRGHPLFLVLQALVVARGQFHVLFLVLLRTGIAAVASVPAVSHCNPGARCSPAFAPAGLRRNPWQGHKVRSLCGNPAFS